MTARRLAVQAVAFALGLALLGWAIALALAPENRRGLEQLKEASPLLAGAVVGLAAASVALNGLIFWVTARPLHRLPCGEVLAVNALATLLAFLPFKLSVVARVAIHRRRDRMPYRALVAWLAATAGLSLATLVVLTAAAMWRRHIDMAWAGAVAAGLAVLVAAAYAGGRLAASRARLDALTLGAGAIGRSVPTVVSHVALRLADVTAQAGRFALVAAALGYPLTFDGAVILASVYFVVGVVSPAGNIGVREGAVFGLGHVVSSLGLGPGELAQIALVVTAGEVVSQLTLGTAAGLWLRPDRLVSARRHPPAGPDGVGSPPT